LIFNYRTVLYHTEHAVVNADFYRTVLNSDFAGIRHDPWHWGDSVGQNLSAIFTKLGAANRAEAIAIALRKQLLKV
jgi:hypothetical protein